MKESDELSSGDLMFLLAEHRPAKWREVLVETGDELAELDVSSDFSECPKCRWAFPSSEIVALTAVYDCPKCGAATTADFQPKQ